VFCDEASQARKNTQDLLLPAKQIHEAIFEFVRRVWVRL